MEIGTKSKTSSILFSIYFIAIHTHVHGFNCTYGFNTFASIVLASSSYSTCLDFYIDIDKT